MKTLIVVLILTSFLQVTLVPLDLCLMVLLLRSFIRPSSDNLYLAFGLGLLVSILNQSQLGLESVIFLFFTELVYFVSKSTLTRNLYSSVAILGLFLVLYQVIEGLIYHQTIQFWPKVPIEVLVSLPLYIVIRVWEERFITRKDIKLKVK